HKESRVRIVKRIGCRGTAVVIDDCDGRRARIAEHAAAARVRETDGDHFTRLNQQVVRNQNGKALAGFPNGKGDSSCPQSVVSRLAGRVVSRYIVDTRGAGSITRAS